ncbi:putative ammonium transporter [Emiliania huxleyi CCMP1516]|uniref:Ammonium transporter AmtB-like domain-containing protein n=2 Tax=Emiliania huxleyi TaxID=2903 RepID=A0A0D3L0L0_EMIH1|nr:putative ammonium transporter [Emiliania huxleyi CCMP1516]EOD41545.1 putative ammonium transporter [Emiliania huxleyi CCMP1516]|eukprot:XP_005793974.1 putative ammonium transporter [Emiliania huxleyi CCMP1516]
MNGIVAGLVGITGPCGVVEPYAAAIIGIVSGAVYCGSWRLHERLRIDDPVHAGAVHAWPGFWGCIASGLFAWPEQAAKLLRVTAEEEEMGVDLAEHLPRDGVTPLKSKMMGAVMRHRGSGSGASSRACGASETTATYA